MTNELPAKRAASRSVSSTSDSKLLGAEAQKKFSPRRCFGLRLEFGMTRDARLPERVDSKVLWGFWILVVLMWLALDSLSLSMSSGCLQSGTVQKESKHVALRVSTLLCVMFVRSLHPKFM